MNSTYKKIILVTNSSKASRAAGQTAIDLAKLHSASLLIVDTVKRPTLVSQWLSSNAEDMFDLVANEKQLRLDSFARNCGETGVEVETRLLVGNSSEEIARMALTEDADIVIRYMKGLNSCRPGPFGTTARNLIRVCPCPLLLVADDKPLLNPKALACVNAEHKQAENAAIIAQTKKLAGSDNWKLLYGWNFRGNEYMAGYISEELMNQYMSDSERIFRKAFNQLLEQNDLAGENDHVHMEQGDPLDLIPEFCLQQSIDVVVMSSASHNHPLRRLIGSTVESILDKLPCSLLVVKPLDFVSPIKPARSSIEAR